MVAMEAALIMPLVSVVQRDVKGDEIAVFIDCPGGIWRGWSPRERPQAASTLTDRGRSRKRSSPENAAALATRTPMAPRPMTPSFLPMMLRADKLRSCLFPPAWRPRRPGPSGSWTHSMAGWTFRAERSRPGEDQLLYGVGVGAGGVEDHDARFAASVQGDVVDAGSGAGDGASRLRAAPCRAWRRSAPGWRRGLAISSPQTVYGARRIVPGRRRGNFIQGSESDTWNVILIRWRIRRCPLQTAS